MRVTIPNAPDELTIRLCRSLVLHPMTDNRACVIPSGEGFSPGRRVGNPDPRSFVGRLGRCEDPARRSWHGLRSMHFAWPVVAWLRLASPEARRWRRSALFDTTLARWDHHGRRLE